MNQLLRLPLLKYTHTQKKIIYMIKKTKRKAVPTSLPKKKAPLQQPPWQQSRNGSCQLLLQRPPL